MQKLWNYTEDMWRSWLESKCKMKKFGELHGGISLNNGMSRCLQTEPQIGTSILYHETWNATMCIKYKLNSMWTVVRSRN